MSDVIADTRVVSFSLYRQGGGATSARGRSNIRKGEGQRQQGGGATSARGRGNVGKREGQCRQEGGALLCAVAYIYIYVSMYRCSI